MAEKRDLLDDLIDIQQDWDAVSHPLNGLANQLSLEPDEVPTFNPSDYKDRPRINSTFCVDVATGHSDACTRCVDICPVNAITVEKNSVKISDSCRKCGLCSAACPTETLISGKVAPKGLYDKIARIAGAYQQCYITCTRALGRIPKANEVVLPCVGAMSDELWFSLVAEFDNLCVYLPVGICDRCRTTTGENAYVTAIGQAEEWTGWSIGLEVDEKKLNREQKRSYKRSQFISSATQAGERLVSRTSPALAGAKAVADRVRNHSKQISEMQRSLEQAVGAKTTAARRRILMGDRKLALVAIQKDPELVRGLHPQVPRCDTSLCTACGECAKACTIHACDLDRSGHFSVETAYCMNCGACVAACPEHALTMVEADRNDLIIVDEEAERRKREAERQKKQLVEKSKQAKQKIKHGLDAIERLDGDEK